MNIIPCSAPTLAVTLYQVTKDAVEMYIQPVVAYEVNVSGVAYSYGVNPVCDCDCDNFIGIVYTICNGLISTEDPELEDVSASYFDRDAESGQTDTVKQLVRNKFPELEFI